MYTLYWSIRWRSTSHHPNNDFSSLIIILIKRFLPNPIFHIFISTSDELHFLLCRGGFRLFVCCCCCCLGISSHSDSRCMRVCVCISLECVHKFSAVVVVVSHIIKSLFLHQRRQNLTYHSFIICLLASSGHHPYTYVSVLAGWKSRYIFQIKIPW